MPQDLDPDVPLIIKLFDDVFYDTYNTRLVHSDSDPEYLPAGLGGNPNDFHCIAFAHGFFSSALHEVAHWCVAGEKRRQQVDFGYWYAPDGRSAEQQQAFYQVEIKPQAFEWIFTVASGRKFRVSTDNLNGDVADDRQFEKDVYQQVQCLLLQGLPKRVEQWAAALSSQFKTNSVYLQAAAYKLPI